jgi:uncharacterized UPF0160 family protein
MSAPKQAKTADLIDQIGTHSGNFHCDEALACYILTKYVPKCKNAVIVRSRDKELLNTLPILVDVGGVYDPATLRFDHHQKGFEETFSEDHKTKLSSAGLVYKHFGRLAIEALTGAAPESETNEIIYQKIYRNFMEAVDGVDNGVAQYDVDVKPNYHNNTGISARVSYLNPGWTSGKQTSEQLLTLFHKAMDLVGGEFDQAVYRAFHHWWPAREIVKTALLERKNVHESGKIMHLTRFTAWKSHMSSLETELQIEPLVEYVIFADSAGSYRVQTVPKQGGKQFEARRDLPQEWWGIRDDALSQKSGVPGCIFVHATGFIGGNKTLEGALAMAAKALTIPVPVAQVE